MTGVLGSIVAFLVAIAILVAFHEYGHFWTARRLGVKVRRFSIGFGKPLLVWRRGPDETEYAISAIPLGGYVQMLDEREGPVPEAERHRAFNTQPLWRRTLIVAAGPVANFLLAIVIYWCVFVVGTAEVRPVVGEVADGSAAAAAAFERGDEIRAIGDRETRSWDRVLMAFMDYGLDGAVVPVQVRTDDGAERQRQLDLSGLGRIGDDPDLLGEIGLEPWRPRLPARVGELVDGGAADQAGLEPGDRVLAVGDQSVDGWRSLVEALESRAGESVTVSIQRNDSERDVTVALNASGNDRGVLGVRPQVPDGAFEDMVHTVRYGPVAALGHAMGDTWRTGALTVEVLGKIVTGEASVKNLSGPINIAQYAGDTAASGLASYVKFLALISISLGVVNLLPIPILDGGHLLYFAAEAVKGSPVSETAQAIGQQLGIVMLVLLMGLAIFNDLVRLTG